MPRSTDGLTDSQLEAVTHPGGPLLVVGAAGTGKTCVLERRFAWLVEQGVPADRVLALALTEPAATEMRERIEGLIEPPYEELHVGTVRSFCSRLLRDEALEAGLDPDFAPMSPADRVALLLDHISELRLRHHDIRGNPAPLLAGFVARIDRLKEEMISATELIIHATEANRAAADADDAGRARGARELEFAEIYADHDRLLADGGALDSGDLVLRAFELLHERPEVRERVGRRFTHLLVDEYQDVNFAQAMLVGLVCEAGRELVVAGDDDQAVHRFRGAAQKNFSDFRRAFGDAPAIELKQSRRSSRAIVATAAAVVAPIAGRTQRQVEAPANGRVSFWRCASERAEAQAVAAEAERLIAAGTPADRIAVFVRSVAGDGPVVEAALEERAVPFRLTGAAAYFQRAEVRDVLAWLRVLADPADSGAAVRALSRPPVALHSVDIARLTQLARRRKLDMPSAVAAALDGPQLTPEGRDRAQAFLRLYRAASSAFEDRRPDQFVLRLIERVGVRRQQVFATRAGTVERLRNIARLPELAATYMRREPQATSRDFTRYLKAVADSGVPNEEAGPAAAIPAVRVVSMQAAKGLEFDHAFVLGLSAGRMPGRGPASEPEEVPDALLKERLPPDGNHEEAMRRLLHVAMTRAREGLVLSWAEDSTGPPNRPSPFYEEARAAVDAGEERFEEELFGPAEGLHSTFRIMRDELLETVSRLGGRLGEMRLDTSVDVSNAVARYLELIKVAALIDRSKGGQPVEEAIGEVNAQLAHATTPEQRELLEASALDDWLRDAGRDSVRRPVAGHNGSEPSLDPFIPRRRGAAEGLMLSASDIETYRICPLKYKFARVFRIPQEPTIHQRFGIALHQVLERFHQHTNGSREALMELFESSWRRAGFGDSDDELQFRERAVDALGRYWEDSLTSDGRPVWFERSFSFKLGPHVLRGRVDRVDRHPDGSYELIDYKTGKARTEEQLREDVQLSVYQMGARQSWKLETSAQSYFYVMTGEKVPVEHSEEQLDRVRETVAQIGEGITRQDFQPTPSAEICSYCDYRIICPAAER
jgi:DNA helicase-2/ATP-dependent DNA helicase PcrA